MPAYPVPGPLLDPRYGSQPLASSVYGKISGVGSTGRILKGYGGIVLPEQQHPCDIAPRALARLQRETKNRRTIPFARMVTLNGGSRLGMQGKESVPSHARPGPFARMWLGRAAGDCRSWASLSLYFQSVYGLLGLLSLAKCLYRSGGGTRSRRARSLLRTEVGSFLIR